MIIVPSAPDCASFIRPMQMLRPFNMRIGEDHTRAAAMAFGNEGHGPADCHHRHGTDDVQPNRGRQLQVAEGDHVGRRLQSGEIDEDVFTEAETEIWLLVKNIGAAAGVVTVGFPFLGQIQPEKGRVILGTREELRISADVGGDAGDPGIGGAHHVGPLIGVHRAIAGAGVIAEVALVHGQGVPQLFEIVFAGDNSGARLCAGQHRKQQGA